jgi:hypothetical protein
MRDALHADPEPDPELRLDLLPNLPQSPMVRDLAERLWQEDAGILAIWLGGSLANRTGSPYSDVDLRVAVPPVDLPRWEAPDFVNALLGGAPLVRHLIRVGEDSFIHQLILASGEILDLLVQSAEVAPIVEPTLVLGCRDDRFAQLLAASDHAPETLSGPALTGELVREIVIDFWVHTLNHRKVLSRHLDLMFPAAMYTKWTLVMRLWYIAATGNDVSPQHFTSIHGLTRLVQAVERVYGDEPLIVCGAPTRTREEIYAAIEGYQDVVSRLGRSLAEQYSFEYPTELEEMTRRAWVTFREAMSS